MQKFFILSSFLMLLSGCSASMNVQQARAVFKQESDTLADWVIANTNYDPYSNEVHIDERELAYRYKLMIDNIKAKLPMYDINTADNYKDHCETYSVDEDWRCAYLDQYIKQASINPKWKQQAVKDFWQKGYTLTQRDYPDGNVNFGSYTVPVVFLSAVAASGSTAIFDPVIKSFTIKKNVATQKSIQTPQDQPPASGSDIAHKLTQLKELKEQGLINEEEFARKKAELLEQF